MQVGGLAAMSKIKDRGTGSVTDSGVDYTVFDGTPDGVAPDLSVFDMTGGEGQKKDSGLQSSVAGNGSEVMTVISWELLVTTLNRAKEINPLIEDCMAELSAGADGVAVRLAFGDGNAQLPAPAGIATRFEGRRFDDRLALQLAGGKEVRLWI